MIGTATRGDRALNGAPAGTAVELVPPPRLRRRPALVAGAIAAICLGAVLAAWAWSLSRVQDYFETDRSVDAKRVAIWGASRTGKAALWAAATDQRFAAVLSCCSGEAGAALLRRNFGKNFAVGGTATRRTRQTRKSGFIDRLEERWRQRPEGHR